MNSGSDLAPAKGFPEQSAATAAAATSLGGRTSSKSKPKTGLPSPVTPATRLTEAEAHERGKESVKERLAWTRPGEARRETRCFPARLSCECFFFFFVQGEKSFPLFSSIPPSSPTFIHSLRRSAPRAS